MKKLAEKSETGKARRISLMHRFYLMFLLFIVAALLLSGTLSYLNMNNFYHEEVKKNLRGATNYLNSVLTADGDQFLQLMDYFKEHKNELHIALDFDGDFHPAEDAFERLWNERYPGRTPGGASVDEMDEETRGAYMLYLYEYYLYYIEQARGAMDLDYTYVVYPVEGQELTMCYFFDAFRDKNDDGELLLGIEVWEDPAIHAQMWEAWNTGRYTEKLDILDNEYGNNYAYSEPVIINGKTVAVVAAEVAVETVNGTIRSMTLRQSAMVGLALLVTSSLMLLVIRSLVLRRISGLEGHMKDYSENKDPALADVVSGELEKLSYSDELTSLSEQFSLLIRELDEYMHNLETVTAERERIGAELSVATNIQASMLPNIFPPFPNRQEFDLYASMDPAKEVGGDFYDFFMTDDRHIAVVIADVSGKGVPAALFMVIARTLIKNHAQAGESPEDVLFHSNNQLCEGNGGELFVTAWIGIIDLMTGELCFSDAGHEYPLLLHENGEQELLKPQRKRPPLAALEGIKYQTNRAQLAPGDTLFLYTDGVPEATNAENRLYGMDRLEELLRGKPVDTAEQLLRDIRADVDIFVGDAPQFDDLTMLAIKLRELMKQGETE